jgi:hypothetical protein
MGALALNRAVMQALQWLPAPLHRALDAWSQRRAQRRKMRRLAARRP